MNDLIAILKSVRDVVQDVFEDISNEDDLNAKEAIKSEVRSYLETRLTEEPDAVPVDTVLCVMGLDEVIYRKSLEIRGNGPPPPTPLPRAPETASGSGEREENDK